MESKSITYFLYELNHAVDQGEIFEKDISGPHQRIRILCTTPIDIGRKFCGAHLRDIEVVENDGKRMFKVACGTCGFVSIPSQPETYRKLGRESFINGHG